MSQGGIHLLILIVYWKLVNAVLLPSSAPCWRWENLIFIVYTLLFFPCRHLQFFLNISVQAFALLCISLCFFQTGIGWELLIYFLPLPPPYIPFYLSGTFIIHVLCFLDRTHLALTLSIMMSISLYFCIVLWRKIWI